LKEDLLGQWVRLRNPIPSARLSVQEILQEPTLLAASLGPYLILVLLSIVAGVLILVAGKLFGL
jgi:hypothetical protein